jgi:hypothetical protein
MEICSVKDNRTPPVRWTRGPKSPLLNVAVLDWRGARACSPVVGLVSHR